MHKANKLNTESQSHNLKFNDFGVVHVIKFISNFARFTNAQSEVTLSETQYTAVL